MQTQPFMRPDRNLACSAADRADDPIARDWGDMALPDAWPDRFDWKRPRDLWRIARSVLGPRRRVELPPDMPGGDLIPTYVRQEFHHLPNGNYSKGITDGYVRGFDLLMLGYMRRARTRLVERLRGCEAVLDVGCGGGGLAGTMHEARIPDVWGLDPSPYLLQHAARRYPAVRFVQGIVEDTGFPTARFDGVGSCFLFHELPPRIAESGLDELHRILVPGGTLVVAEPAPTQFHIRDLGRFLRRHGLAGLYFSLIARWMHEPFVQGWHRRDVGQWLGAHGFTLVEDQEEMPIRFLVARRDG